MDNVALHSRGYPPSLTSTAESWSTGSASRRTPHQSSTGSTGYPAYYFPKTRPHATPQQQHPSPQHSFSSSQQQRQHSPSPRYSPTTEYSNHSNEYHPGESTQSEPGVSADHDRFSAYVNRFSGLDRQRVGGSNSNNLAQSEVGAVSEQIRRYNQRYPDPDPEPGLTSSEEEEQRQTASPVLVPPTQAERLLSQTLATSRQSYPSSSQRQEQSGGRRESASTSVHQRQPRFESPMQQRQPRFESPAQQRSSFRFHSSAGRISTSQGSPTQTPPEPLDDYVQTQDPNESFQSIELSSHTPTSVRDLKKQLWNAEEVLQVAVPPTLAYAEGEYFDQRRSYHPDPEIMSEGKTRDQQASRRRSTGGSTGGQFKSKFYEAALAARLRGKLPQVDRDVPQEVRTQTPIPSFDESPQASPYHMEQLKNASYEARSAAVDQRASAYSDQLRSEKRASNGSRPTPSESKELSRMSDWLEQPRNDTPNKSRNESYQNKTESYRGRETSAGRRGRDPRDERLGTDFSQSVPSSSEQRRGREHSVERRSRGSSKERTRREYSQEPLGRAPSPFIERRIRAFSQEPSARPPLSSADRRARDYSAPRGRRTASIEPRARDRSEEPAGRQSSSLTDQRASDYSAEPRGRRTASIERSNSQVYSEAPRGRRTASMERRARGYSQEPRGPSDSMERKAQDYSEEPRLPREDSASSIERLAREFSGDLHGVEEPAKEKDRGRDQSAERRRREASVEANGRSTSVERCEREASVERTRLADVAAYWQHKTSQRGPPVPSPSLQPPVTSTIRSNDVHDNGPPIGCKDMVQSAPVQQPQRTEEKSGNTNGTDRKNVSKLVAKLNAVNRDDPQEALALIDSILRQESRGSSSGERGQHALEAAAPAPQRESPNPVESLSDEEGESDDETSVSSMTNPTYQSAKPYHDQIQVLSQNPFAPENTPPDPSLEKEASPSPFSPSTSSFRRPRPSALQHYASPMNQEALTKPKEGTMSKAKLKRQLLKDFPPPTTIKVKDSPTPPRVPSPSPGKAQNVRESMTENRAVQQEPLAPPEKALSKLDKFVSNQDALAAKIRVWDEMSNGLNKSRSGDSGQDEAGPAVEVEALPIPEPKIIPRLPAPPDVPSRRDHPWDGQVPARVEKVNIKDTSMDEAMGIETEMTKRGPEYKAPGVAQKAQEFLSSAIQFGRSNSTPAFSVSNDFPDESFEKEPSKFEESFEAEPSKFEESFETEPSNFFLQAPSSNWEVAPRITPEQHENTQRISDDFDAAWVSLPESSFFPEERNPAANPVSTTTGWPQPINRTFQKYSQRRGRGPVDLDMSIDTENTASQRSQSMFPSRENNDILDTSGERGAIEVALLDEDAPRVQDPPENRSAAAPGSANGSARNEPEPKAADSSSSKRRGFLKAFMRKEKKKAATRPKPSVSQTSVGAQSMPALPNRPQPVLPLMPLPPGLDQKEMAPPTGRNSARNAPSRAPVRTRSNSLERFRTASMAKKFSRVMRLYDHD